MQGDLIADIDEFEDSNLRVLVDFVKYLADREASKNMKTGMKIHAEGGSKVTAANSGESVAWYINSPEWSRYACS